MGGFYFIRQNELSILPVVQLHGAPAVTAILKAVVMPAAVRRFIVNEQHVFLQTVHLSFHSCMNILLAHVPDDLIVQLFDFYYIIITQPF